MNVAEGQTVHGASGGPREQQCRYLADHRHPLPHGAQVRRQPRTGALHTAPGTCDAGVTTI